MPTRDELVYSTFSAAASDIQVVGSVLDTIAETFVLVLPAAFVFIIQLGF